MSIYRQVTTHMVHGPKNREPIWVVYLLNIVIRVTHIGRVAGIGQVPRSDQCCLFHITVLRRILCRLYNSSVTLSPR